MRDSQQSAWAMAVMAQLHAAGCQRVVVCPGNRNVPLISAMLERDEQPWQMRSHLDERSAGFRALGWARACGQAVAVLTTSGSALANLLPAVCEAEACGAPLIVLSADRPEREHDCGAPQTMPQAGILQPFTLTHVALPDAPEDQQQWPPLLAHCAAAITQAASTPGPIQINIPLENPQPWQSPSTAIPPLLSPVNEPSPAALPAQAQAAVAPAQRGVVVVGAHSPVAISTLTQWAAAGWPIISDCLGSSRYQGLPNQVHLADLILAAQPDQWQVDTIIRCGDAPLARPVWEWLQRQDQASVLRFDRRPVQRDFCHTQFLYAGAGEAANDLHIPSLATDWAASWLRVQDHCDTILSSHLQEWSELSAAAMACRVPCRAPCRAQQPQQLFVANSLSVRHANIFCGPQAPWQQVWGQRGVNGIDGNLGQALGLCQELGPMRLLIGDCAMIHDSPALAAIAQTQAPLQMVVLDNAGGRIFDQLPAAQDAQLIPWIRTPQTADLCLLAQSFAIPARQVDHAAALQEALSQAIDGPQLIQVLVPDGAQGPLGKLMTQLRKELGA